MNKDTYTGLAGAILESGYRSHPTVEEAEKTLKDAKAFERRMHKAAKRAAKVEAQKAADYELGMETLREMAERSCDSGARLLAAQALIERSGK